MTAVTGRAIRTKPHVYYSRFEEAREPGVFRLSCFAIVIPATLYPGSMRRAI
jgi:hypothetical protein